MFLCILEMVNAVLNRRGSAAARRVRAASLVFEGIKREDLRARPERRPQAWRRPRRARGDRLLGRDCRRRTRTEPRRRKARLVARANAAAFSKTARRRLSLPVRMPDLRLFPARPQICACAQHPTAAAHGGAYRRNRRSARREGRLAAGTRHRRPAYANARPRTR